MRTTMRRWGIHAALALALSGSAQALGQPTVAVDIDPHTDLVPDSPGPGEFEGFMEQGGETVDVGFAFTLTETTDFSKLGWFDWQLDGLGGTTRVGVWIQDNGFWPVDPFLEVTVPSGNQADLDDVWRTVPVSLTLGPARYLIAGIGYDPEADPYAFAVVENPEEIPDIIYPAFDELGPVIRYRETIPAGGTFQELLVPGVHLGPNLFIYDPQPDCNGDGVVDAADLECVTALAERDAVLEAIDSLPGDLDGDGQVVLADFLVLSANYATDKQAYTDGNIDLAGNVAFADFVILAANFGQTPATSGTAAVPEPSSALMLLGAGILLGLQRRRT